MHAIQNLLLDAPLDRQALYCQTKGLAFERVGDGVIVPAGGMLSLDTFVNSFYERYWRDLAGLKSLGLELEISGPCTVRIVRNQPDARPVVLAERDFDGSQSRSLVWTSFKDIPVDDAVIHAEIVARGEAAIVHRGRWVTDQAPPSPVGLALVYCSYGRVAELAESLRRIALAVSETSDILSVIVVDQGKQVLCDTPEVAEILSTDSFAGKLHIIRQDNFGGTGGFTRGMIESLAGRATHVALLDDDTEIDPDILVRLTRLLGYVGTDVTIGGQMLNVRLPTQLSASHESVDLEALTLHNPLHASDLSAAGAAQLFATRHASAYNGWWLCCIPVSVVTQVGLPLPVFIRHDDIEYGTRCTFAGIQVVTMPGIFVWHEPFEAGRAPWISYYDRRNLMITAAVHNGLRLRSALAWYWNDVSPALALDHFGFVAANCLAMEDYLKGPAHVFSEPQRRHSDLQQEHARYSLVAAVLRRSRSRRVTAIAPSNAVRARAMLRFLSDAIWGDKRTARTARTIIRLHVRAILSVCALVINHRRLAFEYRSCASYYSSIEFWRHYLNLDE